MSIFTGKLEADISTLSPSPFLKLNVTTSQVFQPAVQAFFIGGGMGRGQRKGRERRERLPAAIVILKNLFVGEQGPLIGAT